MKYTDIRGIIVPILTPMDENEQINLPVLREQIERMIVGGVNGIFPLGTNGEAYILSEKEKLEVLETAIDQVAGRVPVYAGKWVPTCFQSSHRVLPQPRSMNYTSTTPRLRVR